MDILAKLILPKGTLSCLFSNYSCPTPLPTADYLVQMSSANQKLSTQG